MKFSLSALGFQLMALHEGWLQENFLELGKASDLPPISVEDYQKKHEVALNIGYDYEASTYYIKSSPEIALVPVIGATSKFGGWSSVGTQMLSTLLANAKKSDKYKAVLIYIDSPGGTVDGMQDWSDDIINAGMPTLAFIDGYGASGGYWQAIAADQVVANSKNSNIIGSIGVQTMHIDRREAAKRSIGDVKILRARQSSLKNSVNSFEPLTKEKEEWVIDQLSETATHFINYVSSRRPGIKANSDALKGEVFSGPQAVEEGLIDGLMSLPEAIEALSARINTKKAASSTSKQNQSINHNQSTMKFKQAWAAILAVIGFGAVASEEEAPMVTEERLEQLNGSLAAANQSITDLKSQVTQLQEDVRSTKAALATAEQERDAFKDKAEKLGKQAGASHHIPNSGKPEGGNEETPKSEQEQFVSYAHNKKVLEEISKFS